MNPFENKENSAKCMESAAEKIGGMCRAWWEANKDELARQYGSARPREFYMWSEHSSPKHTNLIEITYTLLVGNGDLVYQCVNVQKEELLKYVNL